MQRSLDDLMHGVFEAFLVSAAAIAIAMVITLIEKLLISSLYKTTEAVAHRLDAIFEAGGNTEYIERLVRATEDTASQSKILEDPLVADLKVVLSELTRQQIEATNISSAQLGREIVASIKEPLAQIGSAVQQVSSDQGHAVTTLLTDVLAGFASEFRICLGGRLLASTRCSGKRSSRSNPLSQSLIKWHRDPMPPAKRQRRSWRQRSAKW